jgi:MFS family permease
LQDRLAIWLILRAVAGAANAWVAISVFAWCLDQLAPLRRPILNSLVFAGVGTGITVVGGMCILLMQARIPSSQAWLVFGTLAIVLSIAIWPAFETATAPPPVSVAGQLAPTFEWNAERVRMVLCFGATGYGYIIPATFLPIMARAAIRDPLIFGWSWPIFGMAALLSTLVAAALPQSLGNRRLWIGSQILMATGVALPVVWPDIAGIMLAALLVGGTFMVTTMVAIRESREVGGPNATGLIAAMTAAFAIGQIVGPLSASYLERGGSFSAALLLASALLTVSAYALRRPPRTTPRSS